MFISEATGEKSTKLSPIKLNIEPKYLYCYSNFYTVITN